ncbi:MAG: transporter, partial [Cyanobacteria bacterium P01_D01_bin.2]
EANFQRYGIELPFPQRDLNIRSPQLSTALSVWKQQAAQDVSPSRQTPAAPRRSSTDDLLADVREYSSLLQNHHQLQDTILERLVKQMRSSGGLDIQKRRFRLGVYPSCFVGSEAVTWLAKTQNATREEAIRMGQALVEKGIFHHVTDEHPFKDEYLFYRFYEDEI